MINNGIKELWNPDEDTIERCLDFGKKINKIII